MKLHSMTIQITSQHLKFDWHDNYTVKITRYYFPYMEGIVMDLDCNGTWKVWKLHDPLLPSAAHKLLYKLTAFKDLA